MPRVVLIALAALLWPLMAPDGAIAPVPLLPGCTVEPGMANAGGTRFSCPGSEWVGPVDLQGGQYVPGNARRLNLNIGAGNHEQRGYVVLSPDVGRGTILEDGHLHRLLLVRARRYGGTEFRTMVRFERGLVVCDRRGCLDVARRLREHR